MKSIRAALFAVLLNNACAISNIPQGDWEDEDSALNEERELTFWKMYFQTENSMPVTRKSNQVG